MYLKLVLSFLTDFYHSKKNFAVAITLAADHQLHVGVDCISYTAGLNDLNEGKLVELKQQLLNFVSFLQANLFPATTGGAMPSTVLYIKEAFSTCHLTSMTYAAAKEEELEDGGKEPQGT